MAGDRLTPPPPAHPPPPSRPRRPGLLLLPRARRPGLLVHHPGPGGGPPLAGGGRFPPRENRLRAGRQPSPPLPRPHPPPGPGHGRARGLHHHRGISPPAHQHAGPPACLTRRPATRRPRPAPAHRRRDQARRQPAHPRLADHPPLPALVLVAAPAPGQSPLVPPPSPPAQANTRSMIKPQSPAPC